MKKKFCFIFCLFSIIVYSYGQDTIVNNGLILKYKFDFIFSGRVDPGMDSLFFIRYKFNPETFQGLSSLQLFNTSNATLLNIGHIANNDTIELKSSNSIVYLILKIYDKNDFPVFTDGIDYNGNHYKLSIELNDGSVIDAHQYKILERKRSGRNR